MRLLVVLVTFLVLGLSLFGNLVWDDHAILEDNASIREPASFVDLVATPFWAERIAEGQNIEPVYAVLHRPLMKVLFHWGVTLGSSGPFALHAVELLLHIGCALLVLDHLLARTTGSESTRLVVATTLALVFAVHPTRAESVAWISGVTDVAMTFFFLVGLRLVATSTSPAHLAAAAAAFALAGWSKESGVLAPVLVLADSVARSRPRTDVVRATSAACAGVFVVVLSWAFAVGHLPASTAHAGPDQTVTRVLATLGTFVQRALWPVPATIFPGLLERGRDGSLLLPPHAIALGVGLVVGTLALVARSVKHPRARASLGGLAIFVVPLVPVSNFVLRDPRSLVSDRFLYLPLVGLVSLVATLLAEAVERLATRRAIAVAGSAALVLACALETLHSSERFADDLALYEHELRLRPDNAEASMGLLFAYERRGELDQAARVGEAALRITSARNDTRRFVASAFPYLAVELARLPDRDQAGLRRVRATFDTLAESDVLRVENPRITVSAHIGQRNAEAARRWRGEFAIPRAIVHGRTGDLPGAVAQLQTLVRADPSRRDAYDVLAIHQARSGDFDGALRTLDAAIRRFPGVSALVRARAQIARCRALSATTVDDPHLTPIRDANVRLLLGSPGDARALVEPVIREHPDTLLAWLVLAQIEEADRSPARALAALDTAARAFPGNAIVAQQRAALLARAPELGGASGSRR